MLLFALFLFITATLWVLFGIFSSQDKDVASGVTGAFGIISFIFLVFSASEIIPKDIDTEMRKYRKLEIEISAYPLEVDFQVKADLWNECVEFDKFIEENHRLCNSVWRGHGYSEKIGNLPNLEDKFKEKFN